MRLWPSRQQWKSWSLPSKLTAIGVLIGLVGLVLTLAIFAASGNFSQLSARLGRQSQRGVPLVALALSNPGTSSVSIFGRGDCVFWLPEGVDGGAPRSAGKYQLLPDKRAKSEPDTLTLQGSSTVTVYARLENQSQGASILEAGSTDLEIIFRQLDGSIQFSGPIPFTRHKIESTTWRIEIRSDSH